MLRRVMTIKNILLTGTNRGIGFKLCKQLSQLSRTEAIIGWTRNGRKCEVLPVEIRDQTQRWFAFSKLFKKVGSHEKYRIRRMERTDIKSALICLECLGLTESESTLEAFMDCDPNAFYVAVTQTDGRVVGVCGAPVGIHSTGFMGLFGVDTNFQKRGIGRQLFELCLEHIGDRNCGLFSIPNKLVAYETVYDFSVKDFKELLVFAGIPQNIEDINILVDDNHQIRQLRHDTNLLSKIITYDKEVHIKSRHQLLTLTLNRSDYKTFTISDKTSDQLLGYGCIRTNNDGYGIIGPVYADNDSIAEILVYNLIKCCETAETKGLLYPTLNCCESSHRIARKLRLKQFSSSPTRFTKFRPPLNHKLIYCIHSPNFSF